MAKANRTKESWQRKLEKLEKLGSDLASCLNQIFLKTTERNY
jgi:hypothetical protein